MPYKSESIPLQGLQDRRKRLTDADRELIRQFYATGNHSLQSLAELFGVSKKTVLLTVNPDSVATAKRYRKENWQKYRQSKQERAEVMRNYRHYKQELYIRGELSEKDT